jgi:Tfp pilus assembly protein PilW
MRRLLVQLRRLRRDSHGLTLPELLVASTLGVIVFGAAATVFIATQRAQPAVDTRARAIQQARFTIDRMTRELRQGWSAPTATATQLSINTFVPSVSCGGAAGTTAIPCRVTYTCTAGTCMRTEAQTNGTAPGPAEKIVTGLSSNNVFSYQPSASAPDYVGVVLAFPGAHGSNAVTLTDGTSLRNPFPST